MTDILKKDGFKITWDNQFAASTALDHDFFAMREWQVEALERLKDSSFMILNAPMGSGKSWLMCLLSAYKMKQDSSLRCIIAVPQTIIAPGFAFANLQMDSGERIYWRLTHNLCHNKKNKKTTDYILAWLEAKNDTFDDRVLLCTHATLVSAYKSLKAKDHLEALQNLLFWIDEAHHVKNVAMTDIEGKVISNEIGSLVKYLTCHDASNVQIGLTTASFFRGDRCTLITDQMEERFTRYNLPYDRYFETMKYLKSFSFDFLVCGYDYIAALETLIKQRRAKDIIYIPHPISNYSTGDKYQEVKDIIESYQKVRGGELLNGSNGLILLQGDEADFKILDLVDEDRENQKEFLNSRELQIERDSLDAIIALGTFKEGANWIHADRCIIVGARNSLVDVVQMIGRVLRDAPGKEHVEVIQLLPFSLDQHSDDFRDNLNNYLKAIYSSLILEDVFNPVKLNIPDVSSKQSNESDDTSRNNLKLSELIPDETTRKSIFEDAVACLTNICVNNENDISVSALQDTFLKEFPGQLNKLGIHEHSHEVAQLILANLCRRTLRMQGISVKDIPFNILQNAHPLEGIIRYTSGACGIDTLKELRRLIQERRDIDLEKWNLYFDLLMNYISSNGDSHVPSEYVVDGYNLGSWVSVQRKEYRRGNLAADRIKRLESIPCWSWNKLDTNWENSFEALKSHFERVQDSSIPEGLVINGINVFNWACVQRKAHGNKKISLDRQRKLESLPLWYWNQSNNRDLRGRNALQSFVEREGHARVPSSHLENGFQLGVWLNQKKESKGELPKSDLDFFESLPGWVWNYGHDQAWDFGFSVLQEYAKVNGHAQPPSGLVFNDFPLATWVKGQREAKKEKRLSKEKRKKLESLPRWSWKVLEDRNKQGFEALDSFVKREGHALVSTGHIENGFKLGQFITLKRQAYNNPKSTHKITEEERKKLESYPWWFWDGDESRWERGKYFLLNFIAREGHSRVKNTHLEEGFELGKWIGIWRYQYNKKTLLQWKIDFFEALPQWSWDIKADRWMEAYNLLKEYVKREGHANVPAKHVEKGIRLDIWVRTQRYSYAEQSYGKKLSQEKIKLLESIPGWYW